MLLVRMTGGLGNQMYCYALYRTLLERGRDVYMDLSYYCHQNNPNVDIREYELSKVFNITERTMKMSELKYFFMRIARRLKVPGLVGLYQEKEGGFSSNMKVFNIKNGILDGYWQSFKYSAEIENILRKEFTFKRVPTGEAAELLNKVCNCNSVSMSIRRGDYLKWNGSLTEGYYINAINYIQERVPNAKFFCVSDGIDYCKNTYGGRGYDIYFVKCPPDNNSYDMQLISQCKHNILANSTFSIWGAWLNQNPGKIVIRPENLYPIIYYDTEDWIIINS